MIFYLFPKLLLAHVQEGQAVGIHPVHKIHAVLRLVGHPVHDFRSGGIGGGDVQYPVLDG